MTPEIFAKSLLTRLALPLSENNVAALIAAQAIEGGDMANSAWFNPLNTMQPMPGASDAGLLVKGIKRYTSWEDGVEATARTLENTKFDYSGILHALARSAAPDETLREWQKSPWGWDKTKALAAAHSLQGYATRVFRSPGIISWSGSTISWLEAREHELKELFTGAKNRKAKIVVAAVGGVVLLGLVIAAVSARK